MLLGSPHYAAPGLPVQISAFDPFHAAYSSLKNATGVSAETCLLSLLRCSSRWMLRYITKGGLQKKKENGKVLIFFP